MRNKLALVAKLSLVFFLIYFIQGSFTAIYAAKTHKHRSHKSAKKAKVTYKASTQVFKPSASPSPSPAAQLKPVAAIPTPTPAIAAGIIPSSPDFDVKSYILIDANSGYVVAEKNSNQRVPPASLTKIMTLYLVADALRSGKIHLNDQAIVSEKAWRTGGSRMFIQVGTRVSIEDLIKGVVVASGNDAAVAIAEHLSGSEEAFLGLMNQTARSLKMDGTNYGDSDGFSENNNNYSTASDLAILTRAWILNFPEYYPWFKEKWFTYNNIKQPNRNRLLWRDSSVDGVKTGYTDYAKGAAGYCLIASALRNDMRLISVVMGAKSDANRTNYSQALLNYGYRFFETRKLFAANASLATPKVLLGKENTSALGLQDNLYITLPIGQHKNLKAKAIITEHLKAPIAKGKVCGTLNVLSGDKIIATRPLIALQDNPRANFIFVMFDYIVMMFRH